MFLKCLLIDLMVFVDLGLLNFVSRIEEVTAIVDWIVFFEDIFNNGI